MARKIEKTRVFGGGGGSTWDDDILTHSPPIVGVRSISLRHGNQVDSIQVTYLLADGTTYTAGKHGDGGGSPSSFTLGEDEMIIRVEGKTNNVLVDQVTFITQKADGTKNKYGPYGKTGQTPFSVDGYVVGFWGRAGNLLDGLGVYYLPPVKKSQQFGGSGGNAFVDPIETHIPPIVRVSGMIIRHGNQVDSIQANYELLGGGTYNGAQHGGSGGNLSQVQFEDGEVITQMSGKTNHVLIDQVTFITTKKDGTKATHGPFGKTGQTPFEVKGSVVGFFGRAGNLLDGLGAFYIG